LFAVVLSAGKYRPTPGGYVHSDCIHQVPSGSHVIDGVNGARVIYPDGTEIQLPKCNYPYPLPNEPKKRPQALPIDSKGQDSIYAHGWQVWTSYLEPNNDTFTAFWGSFGVPAAPPSWPTDDDAILYYFTGLQNYNWVPVPPFKPAPAQFDIIQPVIQYGGGSSNGGGEYWAVANWYVTVYSGAVWSNMIELEAGDEVFGNMTILDSDTWFIGSVVNNGQSSNNLTVSRSRLTSQPWAYVTLEVYNIYSCDWFPTAGNLANFTNLELFVGNFVPVTDFIWDAFSGDNPCNNTISVHGTDNIVIYFNGQ